jgi:hypothetical protein
MVAILRCPRLPDLHFYSSDNDGEHHLTTIISQMPTANLTVGSINMNTIRPCMKNNLSGVHSQVSSSLQMDSGQ